MSETQLFVVDDFLTDPDAVRRIALSEPFVKMHSAGTRTQANFLHVAPYRESFERILGSGISNWEDNDANGRFQCCLASDQVPYHTDSQTWAGVLFLTPDAPVDAGLSFFHGRLTGLRGRSSDPEMMRLTYGEGAEFDRSRWVEIDRVGNIYNRLVLFNAQLAHGASKYFGSNLETGRLFQNFFFNRESAP
jgi:hypothetical protein